MINSYSQNFEDVIVFRALGELEDGFYIDIGAGDPVTNSVTKGLYEIGWSGINVEPILGHFLALVADRPKDTSLRTAVSDYEGSSTLFYVSTDRGELSTTQESIRAALLEQGLAVLELEVPVTTVSAIVESNATPQDIHLLKIDVEGAELEVLRGVDFASIRPWIVVVEVIAGLTSGPREDISEYLKRNNYVEAYFDGMNCYFVAKERDEELLPRFEIPLREFEGYNRPGRTTEAIETLTQLQRMLGCVSADVAEVIVRLDAFMTNQFESNRTLRSEVEELERREATLRGDLAALRDLAFARERMLAHKSAQVEALKAFNFSEIDALRQANVDLLQSSSWRITKPFRIARRPLYYLKAALRQMGSK